MTRHRGTENTETIFSLARSTRQKNIQHNFLHRQQSYVHSDKCIGKSETTGIRGWQIVFPFCPSQQKGKTIFPLRPLRLCGETLQNIFPFRFDPLPADLVDVSPNDRTDSPQHEKRRIHQIYICFPVRLCGYQSQHYIGYKRQDNRKP